MTDLQPLNPAADEEVLAVALDEIREWERKFRNARARRREAQDEENEAKEVLREFFDESGAEFGSVGGRITLRYRRMDVRRLNTKRLRKDHPDLAEAYTDTNEETRMEVVEDDE